MTYTFRLTGRNFSFFSVSFYKGSETVTVPFELRDITLDPSRVPEKPAVRKWAGDEGNPRIQKLREMMKKRKLKKEEPREERVDQIF